MKRALRLTLIAFIGASNAFAQGAWSLKIDKDDILVYTRKLEGEKLEEMRVICSFAGRISDVVAVLLDIEHQNTWSYATRLSYTIKKISDQDLFFYKQIDSPAPVSDRDLVAHLKLQQDPASKVLTILIDAVPDMLPAKKGYIRVPASKEKWLVTSAGGKVSIDFYLKADPGGSLSPFLVNIFSTKGPFETFKGFRRQVLLRKDKISQFPFIVD